MKSVIITDKILNPQTYLELRTWTLSAENRLKEMENLSQEIEEGNPNNMKM